MVHKSREQEFLDKFKSAITDCYGKDPQQSHDYGRIINAHHVRRLQKMLEATKGQVVAGGMESVDPDAHYFPPTLVKSACLDEPLLREEIFGPILPVHTFDTIEEAV